MSDLSNAAPGEGQPSPSGQAATGTPAPQGQAGSAPAASAGKAQSPYFASGKDVFQTREELEKAWKDSYLRREDYTKKTQAAALYRQQLEQKEKEIEERRKEFESKAKDYESYDKFLQSRPDVFNQLRQALSRPPSPEVAYQRAESLVNDKYSAIEKELEEMRAWKREQELEREKSSLYDRLSEELPDFDPKVIDERLTSLSQGQLEDLVRILYHAAKGEKNPLAVEQEITDKLKKKSGSALASAKGSAGGKKPSYKNLDEAKAAALRDHAGG